MEEKPQFFLNYAMEDKNYAYLQNYPVTINLSFPLEMYNKWKDLDLDERIEHLKGVSPEVSLMQDLDIIIHFEEKMPELEQVGGIKDALK